MNWNGYEIYEPPHRGLLGDLTRKQARESFEYLMEVQSRRINLLNRLLAANGIELREDDDSIQSLEDWFRENVEEDPEAPGRLKPAWYSIVNDIGLFLGSVLIRRCPQLHWEFYVYGKKNIAYQRHVVMGFRRVDNSKYNVDFDLGVASYGHRVVAGNRSEFGVFIKMLKSAEELA